MQNEKYIIDTLGIGDWPDDNKDSVLSEVTMRIDTAIVDGLTSEQLTEYRAILDDNQLIINTWLEDNVPDYQENPTFREIELKHDQSYEKNNPAKLFATISWIQINVPDFQARIDRTLQDFKQELSS